MHATLLQAAWEARLAPSILNTQPWRWRSGGARLELHANPARQLLHIDPRGRLMILSCGAVLHHARVALDALGYEPVVERWPDSGRPMLLAHVGAGPERPAGRESVMAYRSLRLRRTDRRPFRAGARVPFDTFAWLRSAAEQEGAHLYVLREQDMEFLRYAARGAHAVGAHDLRSVAEVRRWTSRDPAAGDGVPPGTVVPEVDRPVPVRDFGLGAAAALDPGDGDDTGAEFLVVATEHDNRWDWLSAGEATSAVWLAATAHGLAVSPMSEVVEVPGARTLIRSLLPVPGQPQLVLRVGVPQSPAPQASPRRPAAGIVAET
ncbi:nitroreductase family protein [Dactylosporangium vinaceum]|uniref:Acg family FMN-binding oxidoreductase n=1 Tax=Dactylosporangium vinaceum TaxID=53362 RepID=A0ABV5MCR0_9ACTN|nr:nitroreductase family protein [Dactylosporangium vinaceum]UAC00698.1 nitroreductase family protein [Dactylosporangium vinaceum]